MKLLKGCAWYLLFMAALHSTVGLILYAQPLGAMVLHGVGTIDQPHTDRLAALWFMFSGALMFVLAWFAFWSIKRIGSLPDFLGVACLLLGSGAYVIPVSGLWLYFPLALVLLFRTIQDRKTPQLVSSEPSVP